MMSIKFVLEQLFVYHFKRFSYCHTTCIRYIYGSCQMNKNLWDNVNDSIIKHSKLYATVKNIHFHISFHLPDKLHIHSRFRIWFDLLFSGSSARWRYSKLSVYIHFKFYASKCGFLIICSHIHALSIYSVVKDRRWSQF